MPRLSQRVNYNNFSNGIVSDFNPVNPPENAARILDNVNTGFNGHTLRRLGLEVETDFNLPVDINNNAPGTWLSGYTTDELQDAGIDIFQWRNVDNKPDLFYRVIRIRNTLYIYNEGGTVLSDSLVRYVDLTPYITTSETEAASGPFQAISGKGLLICTGRYYNPFYIQYDSANDVWTVTSIDIRIRDFEGVDDGLEIDKRPTESAVSAEHEYNLTNQGWPLYTGVVTDDDGEDWQQLNSASFGSGVINKTIKWARQKLGYYPSNSDIFYIGAMTNPTDPDAYGAWHWLIWQKINVGNSQAPRGHFIIDPFSGTSRNDVSGLTALTAGESTELRPPAIQFFAGRVWYGAVDGKVFFSQIVTSEDNLGRCYQEQDPTVEDFNELLDTDGGVINIPEIGEILRMEAVGRFLVLFGSNGIWTISGADAPFTANNISVQKVSTVGAIGYRSVVVAEGAVFFWALEGIYVLKEDAATGILVATNITQDKLQSFYNLIPASARATAQGMYDVTDRRIYWAYNDTTSDLTTDTRQRYMNVLVYNLLLNAFWTYTLTAETALVDNPFLMGLFPSASETRTVVEEDVVTSPLMLVVGANTGANSAWAQVNSVTEDAIEFADYNTDSEDWSYVEYLPSFGHTLAVNLTQGLAAVSTDGGISWTETTADITSGNGGTFGEAIAYSDTLGVVSFIGTTGVGYSDDGGYTWSFDLWSVNHGVDWADEFPTTYGNLVGTVTAFVAHSSDSGLTGAVGKNIVTSSDGITYTRVDTTTASNMTNTTARIYGSDTRLMIPAYQSLAGSLDILTYVYAGVTGTSWANGHSISMSGDGLFDMTNGTHAEVPGQIGYDSSKGWLWLFSAGPYPSGTAQDYYMTSSDGITWTSPSNTTNEPSCRYIHTIGTDWIAFVSGSTNLAKYSSDGETWTNIPKESALANMSALASPKAFIELPDGVEVYVVDNADEQVVVDINVGQYAASTVMGLFMLADSAGAYRLTFGTFTSCTMYDWDGLESADLTANANYTASFPVVAFTPTTYDSVVETLPVTLGEPSIQKQATYVHSFFDYKRGGYCLGEGGGLPGGTPDPCDIEQSCLLTGKWHWTLSTATGRWTSPQQAIKRRRYFIPEAVEDPLEDGFGIKTSRLKIRGRGNSLVLRYESEDGKDFVLLGYSIPYTAKAED